MARRISSSRGMSHSGGGFRASSRSGSSFRSSSNFRPSTTRHIGGYRYRTNPYQRNYFFHSLSPAGKVAYIAFVIVMLIILFALEY